MFPGNMLTTAFRWMEVPEDEVRMVKAVLENTKED